MRKLITAGAVASMLVAASSASASIVVNKSIGGVALGMTEARAVSILGAPKSAKTTTDPTTKDYSRRLNYSHGYVLIANGKVTAVMTKSRSQRTSRGAGVGTKERSLRKKVSGLRCSGRGFRQCFKGSGTPGSYFTAFIVNSKTNRVSSVIIGLVGD